MFPKCTGSWTLTKTSPFCDWTLFTNPIWTISYGKGGGVFLNPPEPVWRYNISPTVKSEVSTSLTTPSTVTYPNPFISTSCVNTPIRWLSYTDDD